ncbi:hypothetical protein QBC35DRAFT_14881 [Podospora australis]|uniref:Stf2-like protein n=1 Tax=Podospora australis TaxID=1536484 RepID=A0AAN6X508_9PEZI|nr:hypothetical protein QBC35DRAFT_14881 [Podospora australis]
MTRSHKFNDKAHASVAEITGTTGHPQTQVPKFFGKHGYADADPKKTKKNGGGKANWGSVGLEVEDELFNFTNARRRSNSSGFSSGHLENFKTKFEFNEPEPVFEEGLHGPAEEEEDQEEKVATASSSSGASTSDKI